MLQHLSVSGDNSEDEEEDEKEKKEEKTKEEHQRNSEDVPSTSHDVKHTNYVGLPDRLPGIEGLIIRVT